MISSKLLDSVENVIYFFNLQGSKSRFLFLTFFKESIFIYWGKDFKFPCVKAPVKMEDKQ